MRRYIVHDGDYERVRVTSCSLNDDKILFLSFFVRERSIAGAVGSRIMLQKQAIKIVDEYGYGTPKLPMENMEVNYAKCGYEKETFVHVMAFPGHVKGEENRTFMIKKNDKAGLIEKLYSKLMALYDLPLLKSWSEEIYNVLVVRGYLVSNPIEVYEEVESHLKDFEFVTISADLSVEVFDNLIQGMLRHRRICIGNDPTKSIEVAANTIDEFYCDYAQSVIEGLAEEIKPLVPMPSPKVDGVTLLDKIPFPQQAYIINGMRKTLIHEDSGIIVGEMGTGKTLMAYTLGEAIMLDKYVRKHNVSYEEAVEKVTYRNFVLCPSHLVEKWKKSILADIPNVVVYIITDLKQLEKMALNKHEAPWCREYYIMSKDTGKLSYQYGPAIGKKSTMFEEYTECVKCGSFKSGQGRCYRCGDYSDPVVKMKPTKVYRCPTCDEVIMDKTGNYAQKADDYFFKNRNSDNLSCHNCGGALWSPYVENIGVGDRNEFSWKKIKYRRNKNSKSYVASWVPSAREIDFEDSPYEEAIARSSRKFAPAEYIKKKFPKNYFDVLFVDELHQYKGGDTAQGRMMHLLKQRADKFIGLTGTLAGGYATHLFYLLYRLMPRKMKAFGFDYSDVLDFAKRYGTVEHKFQGSSPSSEVYNETTKGKRVSQPKVKPGISLLIYIDYLFEITTFLNMSDLAAFLPEYIENVIGVKMDDTIMERYRFIETAIKDFINKDRVLGQKMYSTLLQTLLAYPDKPFGFNDIFDPNGNRLVDMSIDVAPGIDELNNKEKRLVDLINSEQAEDRNLFVYAEYTGDGDKFVAGRLMDVIEHHCGLKGKVAFLRSSSPSAREREAWIHKKASQGIKVFICNPRCVETGLDFVFTYEKVAYNYPTLIFYQLGTNLFTLWQASKRAYRLNQTVECRTFYMAYEDSLQQDIVYLMGKKKMATSMLQGKFNTDALCTNGGEDVTHRLINSLKGTVKTDDMNTIESMFKAAGSVSVQLTDDEKDFIEAMKLRNDNKSRNSSVASSNSEVCVSNNDTSVFSLLNVLSNLDKKVVNDASSEKKSVSATISATVQSTKSSSTQKKTRSGKSAKQKKLDKQFFKQRQFGLFD